MPSRAFFGLVAFLLAIQPSIAQERVPPANREVVRQSFAPVVKKAAPTVVNVYARRLVRNMAGPASLLDDPLFRRFFGDQTPFGVPRERVENSLGSGVIVDAAGLIMTNHHVIHGAQEILIVLSDRREFEARTVLSDERADLAVLKVETHGEQLPTIEIGDSDQLQVGDLVLAIGNPFGVGQTVTSGIVSGLARTAIGISDLRSFIQTDAAINPGNSGGALVDLDGHLVGINTAIFSRSGGSIGIGFAIPTNTVRIVLRAVESGGKIVRPWLGATGQGVTAEIAASLGLPHPEGVLLKEVAPASPAANAGLRVGDVVLSVDGHEVSDPEALRFRVATLPANAPARITFWRAGVQSEVMATTTLPPEQPPRQTTTLSGRHPLSGATVANLNPAFSDELGLETTQRGVVVTNLEIGGIADRLGLQPGDILVTLNKRAIDSVAQLQQLLATTPGPWVVVVRRGDKLLSTPLFRG